MSNPISEIPINEQPCVHKLRCNNMHCLRQHPAGWKRPTTCRFGKDCTTPRCQGSGGGAVAFNQKSHQRVPPAQPAPPPPPTVDQIVAKICKLKGLGEISIYMIESVQDKFAMINVLINIDLILKKLRSLFEKEVVEETVLSKTVEEMIECVQQCSNQFSELDRNLFTAFDNMSQALMNQSVSTDSRKLSLGEFMQILSLPEGIEEILKAFESQTASYSHKVSMSPLDVARKNPEGKPDPRLIEFLQLHPKVSGHPMFMEMIALHSSVVKGKSGLTNKDLVGLYDGIIALHELNSVVEEQHEKELSRQAHRKTIDQIVGEIRCLKATNLAVSFKIMMRNRRVFDTFVSELGEAERTLLVQHFSTFMSVYSAWMSMSITRGGSISVESLNAAFAKFRSSFKLDEQSKRVENAFFEFSRNEHFPSFYKLFNVMCPSPDKDGDPEIESSNVLKRFLKAISEIFGSSVRKSADESNRDAEMKSFEMDLVSRGLVLLCLVMMSPEQFSPLVSASFSRTYDEMKKMSFKSFLYWLTQKVTDPRRFNDSTFVWSNLPNFFMVQNKDEEQLFSKESLFETIDNILSDFMSASNIGLNQIDVRKFLKDNSLEWLFGFEEDSHSGACYIYVNEENISQDVKRALLDFYMVDESAEGARNRSHMKSLLSIPKEKLKELVKLIIEMPSSEEPKEYFDILCEMLGLKMSPTEGETTCFGLNKFLGMLQELTLDSDIYSEALAMMSVFSYMQKHGRKSRYFMSLPCSIMFVLITKKFPTLTYTEVANLMYKEMYGHCTKIGTFYVDQKSVGEMLSKIEERSPMRAHLESFTCKGSQDKSSIPKCENLIVEFKSIFERHCPLLHEFLKRAISYFMNPAYIAKLFQDCDEQLEVSTSSQTPEEALDERQKTLFNRFLMQAISRKKSQILSDLSKTFEEIEKTCSVETNLGFYKFARHVSAWINLVNSLFENIGIQHRLSFDEIMKDFPDTKTKSLTPLDKAKRMTRHVCGVLDIPVPENTDDFVQDDENSVLFWIVYQALLATNNTVLPEKKPEDLKEVIVKTISILDLKTLIKGTKTLNEVFSMCLPYMNSGLIRAFLIQILIHHFMGGNKGKLDSLLCLLATFESKFTPDEKASYSDLFAYIEDPSLDISNLASNFVSDEELFEQIMNSLSEDRDWEDPDVSVVISDEIVKRVVKPRVKFVKAPVKAQEPIDNGMAFGGGAAAVADSSEEEEESDQDFMEEVVEDSVKAPFDASELQKLLVSDDRWSAIEYLQSVELGEGEDKDTLEATIPMLKNEQKTCHYVIQALIQRGIFEED